MFPSRIVSVLGKGALENNYSLAFDGSDDGVDISSVISDLNLNAMSVSFWAYIGTMSGGLVCANDNRFRIFMNAPSYDIYFWCSPNSGGAYNGLNTNEWIHFVGTFDSSTGIQKLYADTTPILSLSSRNQTIGEITQMMIGDDISGGSNFDGKIDEVAIWDKALSAGDISALYQARGTADLNDDSNSANLQGWWRMGDGDTYPTITDNSTNSNDGTMTNMAAEDIVEDTP